VTIRSISRLPQRTGRAWFVKKLTHYQFAKCSWNFQANAVVNVSDELEHATGLSPYHRLESCQSNIQCCHGEHNSLLHLEATEDRNRAVQRAGTSETAVTSEIAVTSEETVRTDGPNNVLNIDGRMAGKLRTPKTVQFSRPGQLISNLKEELIHINSSLNTFRLAHF